MVEHSHHRPSSRFMLAILSILFIAHAYIGWRLIPALATSPAGYAVGIVLVLLSLVLMPMAFTNHAAGRFGRFSDLLSGTGSFLMGLFSTLFIATVVRDLVLLGLLVCGSLTPGRLVFSATLVCALTVFVTLTGLLMARMTAPVKRITIRLPGLPAGLQDFTIAQLSDIHVGPTIKRAFIERIVARTNRLNADMIAVTGDVVDGSVTDLQHDIAPMQHLNARHGAFVVTGNHEYFYDANAWCKAFTTLGMTVLNNEHVIVTHGGSKLLVGGVNDYGARHMQAGTPAAASDALRARNTSKAGWPSSNNDVANATVTTVKILLAHQPRSAEQAAMAGFDLQLSGHTHGGQFWPWTPFVKLQQPFIIGLHRVGRM